MTSGTWNPSPERTGYFWRRVVSVGDEDDSSLLIRLRPAEGWAAIPLVMLLAATMAWSIADAKWILGDDHLTSFLVWVGPLAAFWGYVSSRFDLPRWLAHFLGAVIAAFVLPVAVGYIIDPAAASPKAAFDATSNSVAQAYLDLAWRHQLTTTQFGHFCLVLGIIVWGTAQAAAYDVFGHKRAINGVLLMGVILVANMSLTIRDQFGALVLFTATALSLLVQAHAADERSTWLRHRIWRAREVDNPHARGGFAFGSTAIILALVLTTVASSAPLANVWQQPSGNLQDFAVWISHYLPQSGNARIGGSGDFSDTSPITSQFISADTKEFQVRTPGGEGFHWRMVAYDRFGSTGWQFSATTDTVVSAGQPLEDGTEDALPDKAAGRQSMNIQFTVQDRTIRHLITANEPVLVDTATTLTTIVNGGASHTAWASTAANVYTVTALVPTFVGGGNGALTANKLRVAGTDYPAGLKDTYTQGTQFVGTDGRDLLKEILSSGFYAAHALDNPYDIAKAIETYLRADPADHPAGKGFTYNENISSIMPQCTGLSTVDCFARFRQGFCQQYATTMTMLLRLEGIPARYVLGYLPGVEDQNTKVWQVTRRQQHAWVEAYFPGYGWIEFDPTGGSVGLDVTIPAGPATTPAPSHSFNPDATVGLKPRRTPILRPPTGGGTTSSNGDNGPLLLVGGFLALAALLVLLLALRRRPPKIEPPDTVYRSVVRLASRLGYRPLPTQTVYEYTGMLGRIVPAASPQLDVVATAKVETTYAKRELPRDRLEMLARARARLRWALMRLALRRPRRRRRLQ